MANDAPRDSAYNTLTGTIIPMPVNDAQTANDTASSVWLRSIKSPTSTKDAVHLYQGRYTSKALNVVDCNASSALQQLNNIAIIVSPAPLPQGTYFKTC